MLMSSPEESPGDAKGAPKVPFTLNPPSALDVLQADMEEVLCKYPPDHKFHKACTNKLGAKRASQQRASKSPPGPSRDGGLLGKGNFLFKSPL